MLEFCNLVNATHSLLKVLIAPYNNKTIQRGISGKILTSKTSTGRPFTTIQVNIFIQIAVPTVPKERRRIKYIIYFKPFVDHHHIRHSNGNAAYTFELYKKTVVLCISSMLPRTNEYYIADSLAKHGTPLYILIASF